MKKPATNFEHRREPVLPAEKFRLRFILYFLLASGVITFSLFGGMLGYRHFESMGWIDSFMNAAMILSGMGPVAELKTEAGKIFAGCYALFSGIIFLATAALILGPFIHRLLHKFHFDESNKK